MNSVDVVVVGGGLAGLAAALASANAGLETILLAPKGPPDRRTSALMMPSVIYLQEAGLVTDPAEIGHPLTQIRIIDATHRLLRAPETLFDSAEAGLSAFGWNFANVRLTQAFEAAGTRLPNLTTIETSLSALDPSIAGHRLTLANGEEISAALVIGADGKRSLVRGAAGIEVRERQFSEAALVCDLRLGRPLDGTSVEFHYPKGPFTLVPAGGDRANLVWIDERGVLEEAKAASPQEFAARVQKQSQNLFGTIELESAAHIFPLSTLTVERAGQDGVVLVGEAAHAFPPIGAQGLNLGLRDVADLASALRARDQGNPSWAALVSRDYAERRSSDLSRTGTMVDALFRSLLAGMLPAQVLRAGGLWALKLVPALRRQAFSLGMGTR